ncbi:MAG TPA: DUF4160 domain-containing protein [Solirubrobacteraceae bacterium]|jgi:hypothetical protein|nr:DUF4160 domain-containing protein [Solirubrobacteraceae bacterium]
MSRKIQIVLPDPQADKLTQFAANAGEPPSTLAALLVRNGIAHAAKDVKIRALKQAPVIVEVAQIELATLQVLNGSLPPRALRPVRAWARLHTEELADNWERAQALEPLASIEPLP